MTERITPPLPPPPAGPGYDTSRINAKGVSIFFIGFALTLALLFLAVWEMERYLAGPVPARPLDLATPTDVPPLPQPLQPSPGHPALPWQDMAALRDKQERLLHSADTIPGDPTNHHIPIEQAIDQLLESGALKQSWPAASQPYLRSPGEKPALPSVENRT